MGICCGVWQIIVALLELSCAPASNQLKNCAWKFSQAKHFKLGYKSYWRLKCVGVGVFPWQWERAYWLALPKSEAYITSGWGSFSHSILGEGEVFLSPLLRWLAVYSIEDGHSIPYFSAQYAQYQCTSQNWGWHRKIHIWYCVAYPSNTTCCCKYT